MAYQVLLVDDEMPALRFLQSIIDKYAPDFTVAQLCSSSEAALAFLRAHPVDVLITDITMGKMNGIELAMNARKLQSDIHILIISGYAQFEYAQGAIQASVDDYLLKPVSITQMKQVMSRLSALLNEERTEAAATVLPALACDLPYTRADFDRWYAQGRYRFALLRWGGADPRMVKLLGASSLILPVRQEFFALRGRDDNEQILIFPEMELERFLSGVSVYMAQRYGLTTWTVIYQPEPHPLVMLSSFIKQAYPMLSRLSVIGKHQLLPLSLPGGEKEAPLMSVSEINQLQFFCTSGKLGSVKEAFLNLACVMESRATPQRQAYRFLEKLTVQLAGVMPSVKGRYDEIRNALTDLFPYASSYGELMASAYTILFESELNTRDRKLSPREFYDFALRYIEENYAKPLSVQSACDELGISPTYLSRLFRKFGDTTFNTYLMRQRMDAAIALLSEKPDMLLRDVAACVGYEDSSYFAKVFYQYTGKKPSQYVQEQK